MFFICLDNFKHRVSRAGSHVEIFNTGDLFSTLESLEMCLCQIHHVNIVTHAGTILGIIIIAKH